MIFYSPVDLALIDHARHQIKQSLGLFVYGSCPWSLSLSLSLLRLGRGRLLFLLFYLSLFCIGPFCVRLLFLSATLFILVSVFPVSCLQSRFPQPTVQKFGPLFAFSFSCITLFPALCLFLILSSSSSLVFLSLLVLVLLLLVLVLSLPLYNCTQDQVTVRVHANVSGR